MARRGGNKIDGWLAIDKPQGITSADVVRKIKRMLKPLKIGHGGTLDPNATGILPIALGEATKTVPYLMRTLKEYDFVVRWGEARSTDDREGEITETSDVRPELSQVEEAIARFIGDIEQRPPIYSAIKVGGKRAYQLARAGELVELPPRTVRIEALRRTDQGKNPDFAAFHVICGKGTYVRALARDLARELGTVGHVTDIRRTRVGPFDEKSAISLEKLNELSHSARASEGILPVMTALDDIPALAITAGEADRIRNGQALQLPTSRTGTVCLKSGGELVAIGWVEKGLTKPLRVFRY